MKSILKPSIRLSPSKAIPSRNTAGIRSPGQTNSHETPTKSPKKSPKDSATKGKLDGSERTFGSPSRGSTQNVMPSTPPARVALRTEEEQQAAVKEKEQQEMLAHKDARRKSLGEYNLDESTSPELTPWFSKSQSFFCARGNSSYVERR